MFTCLLRCVQANLTGTLTFLVVPCNEFTAENNEVDDLSVSYFCVLLFAVLSQQLRLVAFFFKVFLGYVKASSIHLAQSESGSLMFRSVV